VERAVAVKKVTAILRSECLDRVESRLQEIGVDGITVTHVKGFGECKRFFAFSPDLHVTHARVEIFADECLAARIVETILEHARTGLAGDGLVAVLPVDRAVRIRTGEPFSPTTQPAPPPATKSGSTQLTSVSIQWITLVLAAIGILGAFFVTVNHRMHYILGYVAVVSGLCVVFGLFAFVRRDSKQPDRL
jgi:nitrogen regulatory protein P-II 1